MAVVNLLVMVAVLELVKLDACCYFKDVTPNQPTS